MRVAVLAVLVIKSAVLSPDGTDVYAFSSESNGVITASAPSANEGANLRKAFWIKGAPSALNASSCVTWTSETSSATQQGAALRVVKADGYSRAVTATKNVYFGATWIINLHVWDSRKNPQQRQIGQFDLRPVLWPDGHPAPLPWRLCARAVGSTLDFKVWRLNAEAEPAWGDPSHGGSATVPAKWVQAGKPGAYVGHIPPGGSTTFAGLTTAAL